MENITAYVFWEKYGNPRIQQSRPNSGYFIAKENQCYITGRKHEAPHWPAGKSPILHKQVWQTSFRYGGQTKEQRKIFGKELSKSLLHKKLDRENGNELDIP